PPVACSDNPPGISRALQFFRDDVRRHGAHVGASTLAGLARTSEFVEHNVVHYMTKSELPLDGPVGEALLRAQDDLSCPADIGSETAGNYGLVQSSPDKLWMFAPHFVEQIQQLTASLPGVRPLGPR